MNRKENNELNQHASENDCITYAKNLKPTTASEIFIKIKTSQDLQKKVTELRAINGDNEQQEYKKKNLPYFILGAFRDNHRKADKLISTSFMIFDYDHLDDKFDKVKNELIGDKALFALFTSPRGNGLKAIYLLDNPVTDHKEYSRIYKHYADLYKADLGADPDKTSDASRACFYSYDPEMYINTDAVPLKTDIRMSEPAAGARKPEEKKFEIDGTTPGNRTHTATQLIGKFIEKGMNKDLTLELLQMWNKQNTPPLPEEKVRYTVNDMYDRYEEKSRSLSVEFIEKDNSYFKTIKRGSEFVKTMVTSFRIVPKELLVLQGSDCLKCDIISSQGNEYKDVLLENTDWHTKQKFLKALGHQDCVFLGSENDLQALCQFTQLTIPLRKTGTKVIGLHENVWVVEGMNITCDGLQGNLNIVPYEKGSDAFYHRIQYRKLTRSEYKRLTGIFYDHILNTNERNKIAAYLGWFFCVPVKPVIENITGSFPLIFHHGGQGSGKTSLAELFARMAGYKDPKPNSVTLKSFPMLKLLCSTNAIPQWYDEFKVSDMKENDVDNALRFMRKVYAGEIESKGRADQTVENYKLTAPMAVMGEWNINQPAIMERVVLIRSNDAIKKDRSMQRAFRIIKELDLEGFMPEYVQFCLKQDIADLFISARQFVTEHFRGITVAPRIINNLSVMITGLELFRMYAHKNHLPVPEINYGELLNEQLEEITGTKNGMVRSAVDQLLEELSIMAEKGEIEPTEYKIVEQRGGSRLLALKFREIFRDFKVYAKKTNYEGDLLDETSYHKLFEDCGYIFNKSYGVKFSDGRTYKCLTIDLVKAESAGIRLDGFRSSSYLELPEVTCEKKPKMFENELN